MVGYIFGFLGREAKGPLKLCSQTMGVLQEWRGQGVATALKWAQREQTLAADLSLITWTFDPLESANARINMHKLGAIGRRYWRNIYGEHFGALNQGLPTDRLLVEWWIQGRRVQATQQESRVRDQDAVAVFEVEAPGLSKRVRAFHDDLTAPHLSLEVPADIQRLKRTDLSLAREWRMCVRDAFEKYFASGYVVVDFLAEGQGETRRNHYVLARLTDDLRGWIGIGQS
jgi:predicted GNAT superfamily acetyltransferase